MQHIVRFLYNIYCQTVIFSNGIWQSQFYLNLINIGSEVSIWNNFFMKYSSKIMYIWVPFLKIIIFLNNNNMKRITGICINYSSPTRKLGIRSIFHEGYSWSWTPYHIHLPKLCTCDLEHRLLSKSSCKYYHDFQFNNVKSLQ